MAESAVAEALQKARYNETVQISVSEEEICLCACIDETNGGIQWNPTSQNLHRHLRTKRWIFPMLNDHRRNELYKTAIETASKAVAHSLKHREQLKNDDPLHVRVLDIGTGTGLLGMIAARSLESTLPESTDIRVTSIEMASAMAQIASQVVQDNQLDPIVEIVRGHSCSISSIVEPKASLCVSELLEDGLLGEGLLPALRDAWERHCAVDTAIMIPQGARVFTQAVQGEWMTDFYGPHSSTQEGICLNLDNEGTVLLDASAVLLPVHADKLFRDKHLRPISDTIPLLDFDFKSLDQIPGPEGRRRSIEWTTIADGIVHGFCVWWELELWQDVVYSMEPGKEKWQDHWHQTLHILPSPRQVRAGQSMTLVVTHDDHRISISLLNDDDEASLAKRPRLEENVAPSSASLISPLRAAQLNDSKRMHTLRHAIDHAISLKGRDARVLDIADWGLGALFAAHLGAKYVVSLESSSGRLPVTAARVAQIANGLPSKDHKFEILQCHAENLTVELLGGSPVDIVVAEPYYEVLEGWHLQETLNYYYLLRSLRARHIVSSNACVVPSNCRVMGCIVESEQLRLAYRPCGERGMIHGFDHKTVNQYGGNFHEYNLSLPLWQYDYTMMTSPFQVATLSFDSPRDGPIEEQVSGSFEQAGTCDAMIIWLEYGLTLPDEDQSCILSTMDRSHHQNVRMLKASTVIEAEDLATAKFTCKCTLGGLDRQEDIGFIITVTK